MARNASPETALPLTQRAYTLRLRPALGVDGTADPCKRERRELNDALWATHEAINLGAKAFGEWLLTLRGGLDHALAEAPDKRGNKPVGDALRDRRVMLALSWLTVEDERGAPTAFIVARGDECKDRDSQDGRDRKVIDALRSILAARKLKASEIDAWVQACEPSLTARIRGDAVWVNRSAAFDAISGEWNGLTRSSAKQVLEEFFGSAVEWLSLPERAEAGDDDASGGGGGGDDVQEFRTTARSFLSTHFGTGDRKSVV